MNGDIVDATAITKSFGPQRVLDGVTLQVAEGSVTAVLGPNGAGKSTLVRILTTLTRPDSGTATIAGHDLGRSAAAIRSVISLTGQNAAVDELLTGEENMRLMSRLWHLDRRTSAKRSGELLERFDLTEARGKPVKTYSGGMRRKLDLAISLVGNPKIIFLDEPTTGLDPRSRATMWEIVKELTATGVTVLLTTQYLEEADQLADKIALIDGGKIIAEGTPEHLKRQVGGEMVEFSFPDTETWHRANSVLGGRASASDPEKLTVHVATQGSAEEIRYLFDALVNAGIQADRLNQHKPTLDDVFLSLTGRTTPAAEVA